MNEPRNEPRNELWEKAAAGDIRAIILWEWREYYPHVPTDEVNNLLELVELQQDGYLCCTWTPGATPDSALQGHQIIMPPLVRYLLGGCCQR
jgi:hypothetical protein